MRPETDLSHDLIAPLGPGGAEDASRFGRKAVTLSRLVSMGVPVKPGFAVSAEAVTRLAENGGGRWARASPPRWPASPPVRCWPCAPRRARRNGADPRRCSISARRWRRWSRASARSPPATPPAA